MKNKNLFREIAGIILGGIAILLGLSLISYNSADPSFFTLSSDWTGAVENWGGIAGSFSADLLMQLFGAGSLVIPVTLLAAGYYKLTGREEGARIRYAGFILFLFAASGIVQAHMQGIGGLMGLPVGMNAGGMAGDIAVRVLTTGLGTAGCFIVLMSAAFISMLMLSSFSAIEVLMAAAAISGALWRKIRSGKPIPAMSGIKETSDSPSPVKASPLPVKKTEIVNPAKKQQEVAESAEIEPKWIISDNAGDESYKLPLLSFLNEPPEKKVEYSEEELLANAALLEKKLRDYDVEGRVVQVHPGPVITMYEYEPAAGVKINTVSNLNNDMALAMKAASVRIVAPIPGKSVIGLEIPNKDREIVVLRDILASSEFKKGGHALPLALGKDIFGNSVLADLRAMPHLLIAGATGSGKSVGINAMITSLLFARTPAEVRMLLIDPKMLELVAYENIPHLISPIVVDTKEAITALKRMVVEMERRYMLLAAAGVRNLEGYNGLVKDKEKIMEKLLKRETTGSFEIPDRLPHIVVIVDELADLMLTSAKLVEEPIARLAQMARAAGIHLILATQRPSVNVLTGVIKANFPGRIAFQVSSQIDSRTVIDMKGAEQLLGMGDMLFMHPKNGKISRIHGAFVTEQEIEKVTDFLKAQPVSDKICNLLSTIPGEKIEAVQALQEDGEGQGQSGEDREETYQQAVDLVLSTKKASASFIQRRLRIGYPRAARMIEQMEADGLIGPADGSRPREILVKHYDDGGE